MSPRDRIHEATAEWKITKRYVHFRLFFSKMFYEEKQKALDDFNWWCMDGSISHRDDEATAGRWGSIRQSIKPTNKQTKRARNGHENSEVIPKLPNFYTKFNFSAKNVFLKSTLNEMRELKSKGKPTVASSIDGPSGAITTSTASTRSTFNFNWTDANRLYGEKIKSIYWFRTTIQLKVFNTLLALQ